MTAARAPKTKAELARAAGYSGTPLPRKLGVKPATTLVLLNAPADFEATLGELPEDVTLRRDARKPGERVLLFATSRAELTRNFARAAKLVTTGGTLWLAWPKKQSGISTDLTETPVRELGLAHNWVDYKVCAIDATWSAHAFARRRP